MFSAHGEWISALALADRIGIAKDRATKKRMVRDMVEDLRNEANPERSRIASGDLGYCWAGDNYKLLFDSIQKNLANARSQFRSQYNAIRTYPEFDIKNLNYNLFDCE